jgi:hypothetical protein
MPKRTSVHVRVTGYHYIVSILEMDGWMDGIDILFHTVLI